MPNYGLSESGSQIQGDSNKWYEQIAKQIYQKANDEGWDQQKTREMLKNPKEF